MQTAEGMPGLGSCPHHFPHVLSLTLSRPSCAPLEDLTEGQKESARHKQPVRETEKRDSLFRISNPLRRFDITRRNQTLQKDEE